MTTEDRADAAGQAADIARRLRKSVQTASNDDYSEAGTDKRLRHVQRIETMSDAADFLERADLAAPKAVNELRAYAQKWRDNAFEAAAQIVAQYYPKDLYCQKDIRALISRSESRFPLERAEVVNDIATERKRQIEVKGWTAEHDDTHTNAEMAQAAVCYVMGRTRFGGAYDPENLWPLEWDTSWWKPGTYRRNLVKAAALIIAEIERIDRRAALASAASDEREKR